MSGRFLLMVMVGSLYGMMVGAQTPAPKPVSGPVRQQRQQQKQERVDHIQQQKQENAAFRQTLEGMTPEQRKAAVAEHRRRTPRKTS